MRARATKFHNKKQQKQKKTAQKTQRGKRLLERLLKTKTIEDISAAELNEYNSKFTIADDSIPFPPDLKALS